MSDEAGTSTQERSVRSAPVAATGVAYVRVECNVTRVVQLDGRSVGRTDEILELPPGDHTVTLLAPPENFRPKYRRLTLRANAPDKPTVLRFETR